MSWFFNRKEKPFWVLDIGTEAVKAVIARKHGKRAEILGYSLVYLDDIPNLKQEISKSLEEACSSAVLSNKKINAAILKNAPFVVFPSPEDFHAKIILFEIKRENPKLKITEKEKEQIHEKGFEQAQEEAGESFLDENGILPADIEWLGFKILSQKIDGYLLQDVKGKKGEKVSVKILAVFSPKNHLDAIRKVFSDLELNIVKMSHLAQTLPDCFPAKLETGILADAGGKGTQIFILKNGKLEDLMYFKKGSWDFSEKLSDNFGLDKARARQLKEDYANGCLTPETSQKIKEIFEPEKNAWKRELLEFKNPEYQEVPVFFFGGGCHLKEIRSAFAKRKTALPEIFNIGGNKELSKMPQFTNCFLAVLNEIKNGKENI